MDVITEKTSYVQVSDFVSILPAEPPRLDVPVEAEVLLNSELNTDLLLSEALAGMSEAQSYGLMGIVAQMKSDLASTRGGSESAMREELENQLGVSVDEFLKLQRDQILIDALYRQKIWPRVNITWRDIQREFEQVSLIREVVEEDVERTDAILAALRQGVPLSAIDEAKGSVAIGMIREKTEGGRINEIEQAFNDGLKFSEVAEMFGFPNRGRWENFELGIGGIKDIQVSSKIKEKLIDRSKGEFIEPFELGSSTVWLSILEVQKPISLYNRRVQIELNNALRWVRFNREKNRYVESLWGEGSLEEVKSMAERVANIAVRRYQ